MLYREGWLPAGAAVAAAVAVSHFGPLTWAVAMWVVAASVLVVFRDPRPVIPAEPLAVLCPVDGVVVAVGEQRDEWLDREALAVTLRMHASGIGAVRSPVEGKVMDFFTNFAAADAPPDSPTVYAPWVRTDEGEDVVVSVRTRRFSRFRVDAAPGERIGQGQRNGFVYFGRLVTVTLPLGSHAEVDVGRRLRAGADVVARLVRAPAESPGASRARAKPE